MPFNIPFCCRQCKLSKDNIAFFRILSQRHENPQCISFMPIAWKTCWDQKYGLLTIIFTCHFLVAILNFLMFSADSQTPTLFNSLYVNFSPLSCNLSEIRNRFVTYPCNMPFWNRHIKFSNFFISCNS